jgi:endoglucanase
MATGQQPMLNRDHSIAFWQQVANVYKTNTGVLFDLHNEPYPDGNRDTAAAWDCWKNGTTTSNASACPGSGLSYQAAGMQEIINAVRATGSANPILLGGVQYANALSQWLTYEPQDATGNLLASWHVYSFNVCNSTSCYDATAAPVAAAVPLVAGEIGENDCGTAMLTTLMGWLDAHNSGYLAWTWDTWGTACSNLSLVSNYDGTPTTYGQTYKDHLASLVSPSGDFVLTAGPSSLSVRRDGGTLSYTVAVAPFNGFTGTVGLAVSGLPAGSSASFNPASLTTGNSALTVIVPSSVQRGTYVLTITGTSGTLRHTANVTLVKSQAR